MRVHIAIGFGAVVAIGLAMAAMTHAQAPSDAELRRLTDAYAQAWAKGDAKALAALHTSEALRIGVDGKVAVGRAAIQQAFVEEFAGPFRGTKIALNIGQTSRAAQDVYVGEGTYHIGGGLPPPGVPTRGRYMQTIVRVSGRWLIAGDAPVIHARPPK